MFLCIPIIFGVNDRIKPDLSKGTLQCPCCNNGSVVYARNSKWFELFWIPLIPVYWKHVYHCNICGWRSQTAPPDNPQLAHRGNSGIPLPPYTGGWAEPNHPGYRPTYLVPTYSESQGLAPPPVHLSTKPE